MSRSWKQDRTTPKTTPVKAPRPRVSDFARESYQGKGYQVEAPQDEPEEFGCAEPDCTGNGHCESCFHFDSRGNHP